MKNNTIVESYVLPSKGKVYDVEVVPEVRIRSMTTAEEQKRQQEYAEIQYHKKLRQQKEQRKKLLLLIFEWVFVICLFGGGLLYYAHQFFQSTKKQLAELNDVEISVNQISQLVDNVRQMYAIYPGENSFDAKRLMEVGAIPSKMVQNGQIINNFGGLVIIGPSHSLKNIKEAVESPTFKIGYQGLTKEVCMTLATMDWGDKVKGLLGMSIGSVDYKGNDSAFSDIDKQIEKPKPIEYKDKYGRTRYRRPRLRFRTNVARPDDEFLPTPFTLSQAELGCNCLEKNCSFALHYTVYNVDQPRRVENAIDAEKRMRRNLEKAIEQKNQIYDI